MSVELPKDATGHEIPLDTVTLFNSYGDAYNIVGWMFDTDFLTYNKWANSWRAFSEHGIVLEPEKIYLTPPDSWEKLEEDLSIVEDFEGTPYLDGPACAYAHSIGKLCGECKFYGGTPCVGKMCADIASRIRKLRGENE